MASTDVQLAALKRELAGYEATGNAERAEQVRAQMARLGGETATRAVPETTTRPRARKRA